MLFQGTVPSAWSPWIETWQVLGCWRAGEQDQVDQAAWFSTCPEPSSRMLEVSWVQPHPGLRARKRENKAGCAWLPR